VTLLTEELTLMARFSEKSEILAQQGRWSVAASQFCSMRHSGHWQLCNSVLLDMDVHGSLIVLHLNNMLCAAIVEASLGTDDSSLM